MGTRPLDTLKSVVDWLSVPDGFHLPGEPTAKAIVEGAVNDAPDALRNIGPVREPVGVIKVGTT